MGKDRIRADLDDRIWGIEGTYVGKVRAEGMDADEPLYYVLYHPAVDMHRSGTTFLKTRLKQGDPLRTPEPIPESMIRREVCPHAGDVPGVPPHKVVLMQNRHGDAYWDSHIENRLSDELQRVRQQANRNQSSARVERARNIREKVREKKTRDRDGDDETTEKIKKMLDEDDR